MRHRLALLLVVVSFGGAIASQAVSAAYAAGPHAVLAEIEGVILPVTARFFARAIDKAAEDRARVLIVTLNTPGGLFEPTERIVEAMLAAPLPVVVYVSPSGAEALSAGTFITSAAHVAAMAPNGSIGAASRIESSKDPPLTQTKSRFDMARLIRSIAEKRGRNAEALETTVMDGRLYSASEALQLNMVDLIAEDLDDLMAKLDGKTVYVEGADLVLDTRGLDIVKIDTTLLEKFLKFLANPTLMFALVVLGALGILLDWYLGSFTLFMPAIAGIAFLALAFVGMGQLAVNWGGFVLIAASIILLYFELAIFPGSTVFGALGVVFLALGGMLLFGDFGLPGFDPEPIETPSFRVNPWVAGAISASTFAVLIFVVRDMLAARSPGTTRATTAPSLVGLTGMATTNIAPQGTVHLAGQHWTAVSESGEEISEGEQVLVLATDGVILKVFKAPVSDERKDDRTSGGDPA